MVSPVEEVSRSLSSRVEDIVGSILVIRDAVATRASQCSHLDIALDQLADNHAARSAPRVTSVACVNG